jgi:type IV pilus assembly protein PilY1
MVYFGTGEYLQDSDNNVANTQTQSFYAIWDQCQLGSSTTCTTVPKTLTTTGGLVQQSIIAQTTVGTLNVRATSSNTVKYPPNQGWFMDFVNPNTGLNNGERIVSASILRDGRIIFATLIPIPIITSTTDVCAPSSTSTSWVMVLDAISGASPTTPALGTTLITLSTGKSVPISGQQTTGGSIGTPTIINTSSGSQMYGNDSGGNVEKFNLTSPPPSATGAGRQSWRQL